MHACQQTVSCFPMDAAIMLLSWLCIDKARAKGGRTVPSCPDAHIQDLKSVLAPKHRTSMAVRTKAVKNARDNLK